MKTIEVVAAIIKHEDRILTTQWGYGEFRGFWEFPGGKIEAGETPHEALIREIKEELNIDILVGDLVGTIEYDYPEFHLTMHCFICTFLSGELHLNEHEDLKWLTKETLNSVTWLPADITLINKIKEIL